jgi:hypothetical protein
MMDRARRFHDHRAVDWSGTMRILAMLGVLVALAVAGPSTLRAAETVGGNGVQRPPPAFASRCAPWDEAAGRVISQRAQTTPDVDVRLVSESIAGIRRARRLCALGSLTDACLEYDAVIRSVQRRLQTGALPPMCRSIAAEVPAF